MFEDFIHEIDLPLNNSEGIPENAVYILIATKGDRVTPFYVGQSGRFIKRMKDYKNGHHSAPTDFTVKVAIEFLERNNHKISVKYKKHDDFLHKNKRLAEEDKVIKHMAQHKKWLLNYLPSYYWDAEMDIKDKHKETVETFCKNCIGDS